MTLVNVDLGPRSYDIIIKEGIYTTKCLKNILLNEGYKEDNIKKLFENLEYKEEIKN